MMMMMSWRITLGQQQQQQQLGDIAACSHTEHCAV